MKPILAILLMMALSVVLSAAASGGDFGAAKQLIESGAACSELTDAQLESMGDYYMEQMHPGEAHGLMDRMMGGEGSESLKQAHISMAKRLYCNEELGGMMGMMMTGYNGGMVNMIGNYGYGMMGSGYGMAGYGSGLYNILLLLLIVLAALAIVWLAKQIAAKQESGSGKSARRR